MSQSNRPMPPLNGFAVQLLEDALSKSPTRAILLEINHAWYQISREGEWFRISLLSKKRTIKRSAIFETLSEIYNRSIHGNAWRIAEARGTT